MGCFLCYSHNIWVHDKTKTSVYSGEEEFVGAHEQRALLEFLEGYELPSAIPLALHQKFLKLHQLYSIVGGMPEATARWFDTEDFTEVQKVHASVLQTYEDDFGKYRKRIQPELLRKTMRKIPSLLGEKSSMLI